jgi:hypothetical protein
MKERVIECSCGGHITIDTEPVFGRTIETCDGPCRYRGEARPPFGENPWIGNAQGMKCTRSTKRPIKQTRPCQRCEKHMARSPGARLCRRCFHETEAEKRLSARLRTQTRRAEQSKLRRAS